MIHRNSQRYRLFRHCSYWFRHNESIILTDSSHHAANPLPMRDFMANYSKRHQTNEQTQTEAMAVARSSQKPGQTKQQTKLIAQGIQKGIEVYKKQQKAKARELDKRLKKTGSTPPPLEVDSLPDEPARSTAWLPWSLLALSWAAFAAYGILA